MKDDPQIRRLLAACPPPPADPAGRAHTIRLLRTLPPRPMGAARFLLTQAGFIHKRMWLLQLAFLAGILLLAREAGGAAEADRRLCWQISAAMPLLILINVTDLVRIYNGGMVEVELATRFSLPKVAAARLLIFGLTDGVLLAAVAALTASAARTGLLTMLLYCLVPFDLMCLGCLRLLRRVRPDHFTPVAVALALALAALPLAGGEWLYRQPAEPAWAAAALVLTLALPWQFAALLRELQPGRAGMCLPRL